MKQKKKKLTMGELGDAVGRKLKRSITTEQKRQWGHDAMSVYIALNGRQAFRDIAKKNQKEIRERMGEERYKEKFKSIHASRSALIREGKRKEKEAQNIKEIFGVDIE